MTKQVIKRLSKLLSPLSGYSVAYDGEPLYQGDLVAVYRRLEALQYTVERPDRPAKGVQSVHTVDMVNGNQVKLSDSGWWHRLDVIHVTEKLARKYEANKARFEAKWPDR